MSRQRIEELLDRYLEGKSNPEEHQLVEAWLEENHVPDPHWQSLDAGEKNEWLSNVFADIQQTIRETEPKVVQLKPARKHPWQRLAVAALLLLSFGLYLAWPGIQGRLHPAALSSLSVPQGQQKELRLADGSRVWINAGSALRYPKAFPGATREVYLQGEAYLDVAHNPEKPFIIHTGELVTTVLGTAFDIKEDPGKHFIQVTVTRGRVSVARHGELLGILTPDQQLRFNTLRSQGVRSKVNSQETIAWQQSDLHFEDVSFEDAAARLQQHFGVNIGFAEPKLRHCRFTGTSPQGATLENILKVMCAFNNANYRVKEDGHILIEGPGCN